METFHILNSSKNSNFPPISPKTRVQFAIIANFNSFNFNPLPPASFLWFLFLMNFSLTLSIINGSHNVNCYCYVVLRGSCTRERRKREKKVIWINSLRSYINSQLWNAILKWNKGTKERLSMNLYICD